MPCKWSLGLFCTNTYSDVEAESRKPEVSSDEEEEETAQEKKLRLAKQYLAQLEKEGIVLVFNLMNKLFICKLENISILS